MVRGQAWIGMLPGPCVRCFATVSDVRLAPNVIDVELLRSIGPHLSTDNLDWDARWGRVRFWRA